MLAQKCYLQHYLLYACFSEASLSKIFKWPFFIYCFQYNTTHFRLQYVPNIFNRVYICCAVNKHLSYNEGMLLFIGKRRWGDETTIAKNIFKKIWASLIKISTPWSRLKVSHYNNLVVVVLSCSVWILLSI